MLIYQIVFGTNYGQVLCAFHKESNPSAGVSSSGQYNCFVCNTKAHDEVGFIAKYFEVGMERAARINQSLINSQKYTYHNGALQPFQRTFLHSIGLTDNVIDQYFICTAAGKLTYLHKWNGYTIGSTWFNSPSLANHNAGFAKYKYSVSNIGGLLTPYDDVVRYNQLVICEGEKDMLTAKSMGLPNAVAKVGGATTPIIGGVNFHAKKVVICYDCDDKGRQGALQDADILTQRFACQVKVVDLGLGEAEDLNDYFVKYKHTKDDFLQLIAQTPLHVYQPKNTLNRVEKFVESLSAQERVQLAELLQSKKGD